MLGLTNLVIDLISSGGGHSSVIEHLAAKYLLNSIRHSLQVLGGEEGMSFGCLSSSVR